MIRALRLRRGWRQLDLATAAGISRTSISRVERGHVGEMTMDHVRLTAAALDARLDFTLRWRGADLDRLLGDRHARMHAVAGPLLARFGWERWPEVSFSVFAERGVIDILAWHPNRRTTLVVELKTEIVDVNELVATLDRKRRLALGIARDRGLDPQRVGSLLLVAASTANRARVDRYAALLGPALPVRGIGMRRWLRDPSVRADGLLFLPNDRRGNVTHGIAAQKRIRRRDGVRSEKGSRR